jgi:hypothetical protein
MQDEVADYRSGDEAGECENIGKSVDVFVGG